MKMRLSIVALLGMGAALPLLPADASAVQPPKEFFEAATTERFTFAPGGAIRIVNSYGYLTVEGWDEPEVEITVTKTAGRLYDPGEKAEAERRFAQVNVTTQRSSARELLITTVLPARNPLFASVLPLDRILFTKPLVPNRRRGVTLDYKVLAPRDARLVVRHDTGYVWISDIAGELDVSSHTGDMIVLLPDPGPYAIDARTRLGSVSSDFPGAGRYRFAAGTHYANGRPTPSRQVHLRTGCGSITIKKGPPFSPLWKN